MNTITRRTALAMPVTLPLLPVSAYAAPADPLLAALPEWQAIRADYLRALENFADLESRYGNCSPESEVYHDGRVNDLQDRMIACECRMADMVATTAAGMAGQLRVMAFAFGHFDKAADGETEAQFVRSLLAAAENLAGEGVS